MSGRFKQGQRLIICVGALIAAALLLACGDKNQSTPTTTPTHPATATRQPSAPASCLSDGERDYVLANAELSQRGSAAVGEFAQLMQDPQPSSEEWLATLGAKAGAIEMVLNDARLLTAPPDLTNVHDHFVTANEFYLDAALSTLEAYEAGTLPSVAKLGEAVREIEAYEAALNAFYAERETGCSEETPLPQT